MCKGPVVVVGGAWCLTNSEERWLECGEAGGLEGCAGQGLEDAEHPGVGVNFKILARA